MDLNRELLSRFVDGELSPQEAERVALQLGQHPEWDAYVQQQEALRGALQSRFRDLDHTVPERLVKAALETPVSRRWRIQRALRSKDTMQWLGVTGAAMAAGMVVGFMMQPQRDIALNASGQLLARGSLGHILDDRLAANNPVGAATRVGISFRSRSGQDCRTFSSDGIAGLACHAKGEWVIATIVRHEAEASRAPYRMAGSEMPEAVRQAVTASMAGEPFDATAEARARTNGWSGR